MIKTDEEIGNLRESGHRLAEVMDELLLTAVPGTTTGKLGELAEELIRQKGGIPVFKGYGAEWGKPFPAAVCTSVNHEIVHGIPSSDRVLREGDLLKLDIGLRFRGMVSDMARTKAIGEVSDEALRLMTVTREALDRGISKIRSGARLSDYARAVESRARQGGYSVVRDLVGHGVGRELHEDPQIPNYFVKGMENFSFRKGMTVALEPMVNAGAPGTRVASDGWTCVTGDGRLSAHFEDTIVVTERGSEILTRIR